MKLSGEYLFSAPREAVWALLNDPETLRRIIPGCERLEQIGDDLYSADIKLGLAGVRGDYSGTVRISEQQPPERYRLEGDGRGKPGFAKGVGDVELTAEDNGTTTMRYTANAQVGGPVAGIGQRLIEGAAKSIINQSLKALSAELEARQSSPPEDDGKQSETESVAAPPTMETVLEPHGHGGAPAVPAPLSITPPRRATDAGSSAGLTTTDLLRGMVSDVLGERPALRWALPLMGGFALGLLAGLRLAATGRRIR